METLVIKKAFTAATKPNNIHEAVLFVESTKGDFSERHGYGGRDIDTPMIMASITKMFTTACVLKLCEEKRMSLDDKLPLYFSDEDLRGLHVLGGHEYSRDLTVSDLLFQTSGLSDSFESANQSASAMMKAILREDVFLSFDDAIAETKLLKPRFAPNTGGKAYYANINFDLLGEIIEKVAQQSLADVYKQFIFEPLNLHKTYLPVDEKDSVPHLFYKMQRLERPKLIASCRASGGCVTTTKELMAFSKGFWAGKLFDKKVFSRLSVYKKVQANKGPIYYGGGYMRISLEGMTTLFMGKGELLGHSGSTGSFAFYYPRKDLHIVGDLAQFANPALPIRLVMRLAMSVK
jgi:CubicO group peptidase (beta-lactamase class C family)